MRDHVPSLPCRNMFRAHNAGSCSELTMRDHVPKPQCGIMFRAHNQGSLKGALKFVGRGIREEQIYLQPFLLPLIAQNLLSNMCRLRLKRKQPPPKEVILRRLIFGAFTGFEYELLCTRVLNTSLSACAHHSPIIRSSCLTVLSCAQKSS